MDKKRSIAPEEKDINVKKIQRVDTSSILRYFKKNDSFPDACSLILTHPTMGRILFYDGKFGIISEDKVCETVGGITSAIRAKFFSDYERHIKWTAKEFASSMALGEMVHRHIHHIHTCSVSGTCDCDKKTSMKRINGLAKVAQRFLREFDIKPRGTEIKIASLRAKKCTKLDMIGERWSDSQNKMSVIISWKTGYYHDYDQNKKGTMLQGPLGDYLSTPQHHNHIQSIIEYKILEEEYGIKFDEYIIVYLGHRGKDTFDVEYLKEQDLFKKMATKTYEAFCKV